jgi:hypothetical protein
MQGETVHPWSMILSPHSFALRKYSHVQPVWKCAGMQEEDLQSMRRLGRDPKDVDDVAWFFRHKGGRCSWLDPCFSLASVLAELSLGYVF